MVPLVLLLILVGNLTVGNVTDLAYTSEVYLDYEQDVPTFYVDSPAAFRFQPVVVEASSNLSLLVIENGFRVGKGGELVVTDQLVDTETERPAILFTPLAPSEPFLENASVVWLDDPLRLGSSEVMARWRLPEKREGEVVVAKYADGSIATTRLGNKIYVGFEPDADTMANLLLMQTLKPVQKTPATSTILVVVTAISAFALFLYILLQKFWEKLLLAIGSIIAVAGFKQLEYGDEVLLNEIRREIYDYLVENPGAHLREIKREVGISMGTTVWHLEVLKKAQFVVSMKHENKLVFFPKGYNPKDFIMFLEARGGIPKRILEYLTVEEGAHLRKIARDLMLNAETVRYHLRKFERVGIIIGTREGNKIVYQLS